MSLQTWDETAESRASREATADSQAGGIVECALCVAFVAVAVLSLVLPLFDAVRGLLNG